nr:serine hydrolase [Kutzneria buriramensis]WKX12546.1 serine hydrolase [Kutzneria buriramensis]
MAQRPISWSDPLPSDCSAGPCKGLKWTALWWPEFAANGKAEIPVRWLLSHQAGLVALDQPVPLTEALAWKPMLASVRSCRSGSAAATGPRMRPPRPRTTPSPQRRRGRRTPVPARPGCEYAE